MRAIKGRTALRIGAVVVGLVALGWNQLHQQAAMEPVDATPVTAAIKPMAPAKSPAWRLGSLTLTPCELGQPNSGLSTAAWCAPFAVPENRDDPHSRKIKLKLAVMRSQCPGGQQGHAGVAGRRSWPGGDRVGGLAWPPRCSR